MGQAPYPDPSKPFIAQMSENDSVDSVPPGKNVSFREIAPAIEFACWVLVALAPFLRWINGAAVTDDQYAFQIAIVALALIGALGLRIYNYWQGNLGLASIAQSPRE